jgi:hypothetical protein
MFLVAFLLSAVPHAHAVIYGGNPGLSLAVDHDQHDFDSGSVYLTKIRVLNCGSGYTDYSVGEWIDPVAGYQIGISAGDYCNVTLFWGSTLTVDGVGQGGAFGISYSQSVTGLTLGNAPSWADLLPYTVTYGVIYGGNPGVRVVIQ